MTAREIQHALSDYFPPEDIGWKPQATSGNKALAIAYIDARNVMDRLDAVVGTENWRDTYAVLADGNVVCTLSVRIEGEWLPKSDVGGESDQKDTGDKCKAAFSDALKRAAVKWGIGRFLYSLPAQWCDYDPQKKQFARTPSLPAWAVPKAAPAPAKPAAPTMTEANQKRADQMKRDEERLVGAGMCKEYDLRKIASKAAQTVGCGAKAESWSEAGWLAAIAAAQAFELDCADRAPASVDQRIELDRLLIARGRVMADVVAKFGCSDPAAITSSQAEKAMELLRQMPDVARETKATKTRK